MPLERLTHELFATAPPLAKMKGHADYQGWATAVVRLAESADVAPFRPVLLDIAGDALVTMQPWERFLEHDAGRVPFDATERAMTASGREANPPAALLLALLCVHSWMRAAGPSLYDQDAAGRPSRAWTVLPQGLAAAGLRVGAHLAARHIAEEAYDVLVASKHAYWAPIQEAIVRCRHLARECSVGFERCVRDLADDLRSQCGTDAPGVRSEFAAMLWTLGLVPQSLVFHSMGACGVLPTRRVAKEIVRRSMACMRHDRLLQYVWLELKDNESFPLRTHEELFGIINNTFADDEAYTLLELLLGEAPGRVYARTLIAWFRGTLGAADRDRYIRLVASIAAQHWPEEHRFTLLRMLYLGLFLGRRAGWPEGFKADEAEDLGVMREWLVRAQAERRGLTRFPELPDPGTAMTLSLHEVLEQELRPQVDAAGEIERAWDVLEGFRGSALEYWMCVTPPAFPDAEMESAGRRFAAEVDRLSWAGRVDNLLFQEEERIAWLRGAYFAILYDSLPQHFRRYAAEQRVFRKHQGTGLQLNPTTGRKEYQEIHRQLRALYDQLAEVVPQYTRARTQSHVTWADVVEAAERHRHGDPTRGAIPQAF
jgi:hypothetical protein